MPVTTLFFDLDDTLLETYPAHIAALDAGCRRAEEQYPHLSRLELREGFIVAHNSLETEMESGRRQFSSQRAFRIQTWETVLGAHGLPSDLAEELADRYIQVRRSQYRLYPEVASLLDELTSHYRLVLVTNGIGELQREKVASVGLDRWFEHIVVSGEVASWKPDTGIFQHALQRSNSRPEDVVMIGDNLQRDIRGAGALGIRTIWVRRYAHLAPDPTIHPSAELSELTPLPELLLNWRA